MIEYYYSPIGVGDSTFFFNKHAQRVCAPAGRKYAVALWVATVVSSVLQDIFVFCKIYFQEVFECCRGIVHICRQCRQQGKTAILIKIKVTRRKYWLGVCRQKYALL